MDYSFLHNADPAAIDDLYQEFCRDPQAVDSEWQLFFKGFELGAVQDGEGGDLKFSRPATAAASQVEKEAKVLKLIAGYRQRGHLFTKTNPVRERRKYGSPLTLDSFGLDESDLDQVFHAGTEITLGPATLRDIVAHLEETYCESVGVEYQYIRKPEMLRWLQQRMESCRNKTAFSKDDKTHILKMLTKAVLFERFMGNKFVGQKRFSLEGLEATIPALNAVVEKGAELGIEEFVLGMPHRGRLNVLSNIVGKPYEEIFFEFSGVGFEDNSFAGDVKYHQGFSADQETRSGKKVHFRVAANPSHLEAVGPVVEGIVRSKLDHTYNEDLKKIAPIIIHGDASIAGQGVVYEVIQMSQLPGYKTGGTIHVVMNNQIGFTTNYLDARSSTYCTDVGKVTLSPVFHVNGDDVEAVVHVVRLALEFRQKFHKDVLIDVLGYRKHGHNEGDEPRFTQPTLYKLIEKHPDPLEIYTRKLIANQDFSPEIPAKIKEDFQQLMEKKLQESRKFVAAPAKPFLGERWAAIHRATPEDFIRSEPTGIPEERLTALALKVTSLPEGPDFFRKIKRLLQGRQKMVLEEGKLDWAMAETLAYASLLDEGIPVRLSGQDVERGTFAHRHAVLKVDDSQDSYVPLQNISPQQAPFRVFNSLLSEYGVLGFDFGYALHRPDCLTIWEAQFGDFANGAQIIFDQFLSCSETKWQRMNGLVLYMPHGYEGQGPEHSSARLERYLALCGENNMQVVNCTTPANFFHLLRRQIHRKIRLPLLVMTPKSLLRHPACVSDLADVSEGRGFQEVMDDAQTQVEKVRRILLCTGKIYYELLAKQQEEKREDIAIVRVEQLYPYPQEQLEELFQKYHNHNELCWVQEEPENMGAWPFYFRKLYTRGIKGIHRKESGTTATGFSEQHKIEQQAILKQAFTNTNH